MRGMKLMLAVVLAMGMGQVMAQSGRYFPKSNDLQHVQSVRVSVKSLIRQCPQISYEHTVAPGKGSVEGTIGWFTSGETNELQGALLKLGYKWTFPMGKKARPLSQGSYLCSGFYLKPELAYVHRSRWYESFTYNDGWDMYFDNIKYADNNLSLMLMMGFQKVWDHFILEYSFGFGRYWSSDAFHQGWTYGYTALGGSNRGLSTYNTIKIGFPF